MIRDKIKEIVDNIDKFELSENNFYKYKNILLEVHACPIDRCTLNISNSWIPLSTEEGLLIREAMWEIEDKKLNKALSSITFEEK